MSLELEELYQEVILDHSRRPRNFGDLADAAVRVQASRAMWVGKINVYSSDDGVMQALDERVNRLPAPFELEWHHVSGNPWDWRLVRVSNPAFQIPADVSY